MPCKPFCKLKFKRGSLDNLLAFQKLAWHKPENIDLSQSWRKKKSYSRWFQTCKLLLVDVDLGVQTFARRCRSLPSWSIFAALLPLRWLRPRGYLSDFVSVCLSSNGSRFNGSKWFPVPFSEDENDTVCLSQSLFCLCACLSLFSISLI